MPSKPITLGDLHFAKKGDALAHLKAMLRRYDVGDRVSSADGKILYAALSLHRDAVQKIGCGVTHFSVRSADFGSKCFWVNRSDGTTEDFSYITCLKN